MKSRTIFSILIVTLFTSFGFAATQKVNEIPATTSSQEALASFNKGLYFLDVAKGLEARTEFLNAVEKDPAFSHAYFYLSLSSLSPEEFKESIDKGMQNIQGKSEGEKILLEINRTFIDNDAAKRVELSKKLVTLYPQAPRAWLRLGFTQGSINHHVEARQAFEKALQLDPKLIGTPFALTFSYLFNEPKDFARAKKYIEQAIQLQPHEAKCYETLGDVYRALNELEKARDAYSKAIETDPKLDVATLKKGHIDSFLGRFDEARADYDKGIAGTQAVNKIGYANFRAFTYLHAGQPKVALQELQKLVDSADTSGLPQDQADAAKLATLNNSIIIALHNNLLDDAQKILDQIREVTNQNIKRVGDKDFERQQNAILVLLEGQIAARKGDYKTAQAKAEENKQMIQNDSSPRKLEGYYGLLATVERLQGHHAQAVELYKKADLTILYVKYQYGVELDAVGNKQEARKILREVAQFNFNTVDFAMVRKDAKRLAA